jgi:hypothetical protein
MSDKSSYVNQQKAIKTGFFVILSPGAVKKDKSGMKQTGHYKKAGGREGKWTE